MKKTDPSFLLVLGVFVVALFTFRGKAWIEKALDVVGEGFKRVKYIPKSQISLDSNLLLMINIW